MVLIKNMRQHYKKENGAWVPKEAYDDEWKARAVVGRFSSQKYVYLCSICNKYHLGRNSKKAKKR